jgi:predicted membrane channel-forming protein YqfA (hemolysin III family)
MKSAEAIKERLKVNIEKLKIVATITILLTGGLTGLLFRGMENSLNITLFITGLTLYIVAVIYLWKLNNTIEKLLISMEDDNA